MAWTDEEIAGLRERRANLLAWIEAIENGQPIGSETEEGRRVDDPAADLAQHKEHLAEIEQILTSRGVP